MQPTCHWCSHGPSGKGASSAQRHNVIARELTSSLPEIPADIPPLFLPQDIISCIIQLSNIIKCPIGLVPIPCSMQQRSAYSEALKSDDGVKTTVLFTSIENSY